MSDKSGFWGNRTATIDWCEQNYEVTYYIAEFWNTVSNLVMILFPLYGIYWSYKQKTSRKFNSFRVTYSMIACHLGLMLVGSGSWMFHMTLLYPMQLLDELPMIFGSGILIYAHYDLFLSAYQLDYQAKRNRAVSTKKSRSAIFKFFAYRPCVLALIVTYCVSVAYIYMYIWNNPIFHEIAYAIMVFTIILLSLVNIKYYKFSNRLCLVSMFYYGLGFALWNVDNQMCEYLRTYRQAFETFFGVGQVTSGEFNARALALNVFVVTIKSLTELHALWHVFTGYASFMCILFLTELSYEHHLRSVDTVVGQKRPVTSKCCRMYYHLTSLESETHKVNKSAKTK